VWRILNIPDNNHVHTEKSTRLPKIDPRYNNTLPSLGKYYDGGKNLYLYFGLYPSYSIGKIIDTHPAMLLWCFP
jgi:hypothetical protein